VSDPYSLAKPTASRGGLVAISIGSGGTLPCSDCKRSDGNMAVVAMYEDGTTIRTCTLCHRIAAEKAFDAFVGRFRRALPGGSRIEEVKSAQWSGPLTPWRRIVCDCGWRSSIFPLERDSTLDHALETLGELTIHRSEVPHLGT
jgi:hypothetical protein